MGLSSKDRFKGILLSIPTFADQDHNLLLNRQRIHFNWLIDNGMTEGNAVLMVAGGMGEGYFLEDTEWRALAETAAEEANGRVPTVIGVYELSARRAAGKARQAADAGIDCIQVTPTHYFAPDEKEVFQNYKFINDSVDIAIIPYNAPWAMPNPGFEFSQSLLERFTELENIVGLKWSSYNYRHYLRMIRIFKNRFNFFDTDRLLSHGARLGSKGFADDVGNAAPRLSLKKWQLLKERKYDEFDQLDMKFDHDPISRDLKPD
jgi:4-hydroxy-tetrahydrodipicolinate synthase